MDYPDNVILLDDALARRTATAAGLNVWGTLRILLEAKSQGLIENVKPQVNRLEEAGLWVSEGGFWTGKQFKTFQDFPTVSKVSAFDKLVAAIASSGYQITNSNKDLGIISASQTVSYGQGKTVPLNAVVRDKTSGGIRVELVFTLSGGLATSADSVQEEYRTASTARRLLVGSRPAAGYCKR